MTAATSPSSVPLLVVQSLVKAFGGVRAVDDVSFSVAPGRIHALIGPNGAGKTTLFNLVAGVVTPSSGQMTFAGADITRLPPMLRARAGLQRTFQNLQTFGELTALENVMVGRHIHSNTRFLPAMLGLPGVRRSNRAAQDKAEALMRTVGLSAYLGARADALPYGALKRLDIARALATEPSLLLMDEPAAGLNPSETVAMTELIRRITAGGVTVVLVEHDMKLVMNLSEHIVVLDRGRKLAEGSPEAVRADPAVIAAYLGSGTTRRRRK
ncbi:ABC transporter ATP-binding protein [Xanthobacter dioxanivorans]|uniref:ABC transporter ATP-binding protein n=1 Tax=Xanthobacter dioxanivorans TaxID=2528964 RepID=A0A974PNT6_9HYPH|nr:ABC transporter ATP-binding protein [Xanthobacter dioxanivorans]QRG07018.1 ABC transporter ATP-binding protein [Xanthobacter dioxanivorans]